MTRKRMVLLGVATFVLGCIILFPARIAIGWFAPPGVQFSGVSGTLWNGQAMHGVAADIYLNNTTWSFKPLALLTGKASLDFSTQTTAGRINGNVAAGITGAITLSDFTGRLSLSAIHPALAQNGVEGSVDVQMETVVLKDGFPTDAAGIVLLNSLTTRAFGNESLGSYRATISSSDDGIIAQVEDTAGPVDLTGNASLTSDRLYLFTGLVGETASTPPIIRQNLRFLGSADENGQREFRFEGSL